MQLSSYVLKLKSDLGECLGCSVLLERHIHADAIFNKVYVYFMTKFIPGKMQGHLVNIQSTLSCVGCFYCSLVLGEMFGCKTIDFCLFFS